MIKIGGPGQIAHLAPTYAAVNALCLLQDQQAYQVIDRFDKKSHFISIQRDCLFFSERLSTWLNTLRDPSNGSFSLHVDGESDIRYENEFDFISK